jgi:hypothetical protein
MDVSLKKLRTAPAVSSVMIFWVVAACSLVGCLPSYKICSTLRRTPDLTRNLSRFPVFEPEASHAGSTITNHYAISHIITCSSITMTSLKRSIFKTWPKLLPATPMFPTCCLRMEQFIVSAERDVRTGSTCTLLVHKQRYGEERAGRRAPGLYSRTRHSVHQCRHSVFAVTTPPSLSSLYNTDHRLIPMNV